MQRSTQLLLFRQHLIFYKFWSLCEIKKGFGRNILLKASKTKVSFGLITKQYCLQYQNSVIILAIVLKSQVHTQSQMHF